MFSSVPYSPVPATMSADSRFSFRSARSGAVSAGMALAVDVEAAVVRLWLHRTHTLWAWSTTTLGLVTFVWLVVQYRAFGTTQLRVSAARVELRVPGHGQLHVPRAQIATATVPTWRELPESGTCGYLNLMAPAEPNVLLALTGPARVPVLGGFVRRSVTHLALRVEDPHSFLQSLTVDPPQPKNP